MKALKKTESRPMKEATNEIVVYQPDETMRLEVRLENETVWLNQSRMGDLFGVDRTVVNRHIRNIYKSGELEESATCAKIAQVQSEGGRTVSRVVPFYSLDMIIAVGYRVNSLRATRFRQWATGVLREYLLKGYAVRASEVFHDRFLVIDNKELYLVGASLKDLGKKCFAFTRLDAHEIGGLKARI